MREIIKKTKKLAEKEIKKRDKKISKIELERRALKIAIAAIFYGDLKTNRKNNVVFDLKKFVSFEGDTGPYILYTYARANSILKKSTINKKFEAFEMEDSEIGLVKKISMFSSIVNKAEKDLNPSIIANYIYQLSQNFNEFYHACKVIGSREEIFRIALVEAFRQVSKNALHLLGIETLEEM